VLGLWLRVESATGAWAVSLATGSTVRLPDEEPVSVPLPDPVPDVGYLPIDDAILRQAITTAAVLVGVSR
jgi:hypothetical protein